ncbi:MAG: GlsB/YeaQ/YmgE family stress response membrane protein [Dehalococcoidia bacterium]
MSVIAWVLLGLVAGALAKLLMPGRDPGGVLATILIGIAGAIVGGFIWNAFTGNDSYGDFDVGGILIAVLGSIILLWAYRQLVARREVR